MTAQNTPKPIIAASYFDIFPEENTPEKRARMEAAVAEFGAHTAFGWRRDANGVPFAVWACTCGEHGETAHRTGKTAVTKMGDEANKAIRAHRAAAHS